MVDLLDTIYNSQNHGSIHGIEASFIFISRCIPQLLADIQVSLHGSFQSRFGLSHVEAEQ